MVIIVLPKFSLIEEVTFDVHIKFMVHLPLHIIYNSTVWTFSQASFENIMGTYLFYKII